MIRGRPLCISHHVCYSVSALKDREERYRLHLNRQFETLSDAKNIEEQVRPSASCSSSIRLQFLS